MWDDLFQGKIENDGGDGDGDGDRPDIVIAVAGDDEDPVILALNLDPDVPGATFVEYRFLLGKKPTLSPDPVAIHYMTELHRCSLPDEIADGDEGEDAEKSEGCERFSAPEGQTVVDDVPGEISEIIGTQLPFSCSVHGYEDFLAAEEVESTKENGVEIEIEDRS